MYSYWRLGDIVELVDVNQKTAALSSKSVLSLKWAGAFLALLAEVVLLQWLGGAYGSGFGGHPDEAAHFVSSLMVRDFFQHLGSVRPLEFAQSYYLHYPKVAIGNWPPMLYGVAGAWFFLFGASRASALIFTAVIVAATALLIQAIGRKLIAPAAGWFAAALYAALPLVQESSAMMMAEPLVTLLILAATAQFARFAESGSSRDALLFGALATLAILTRGSAWALTFIPPIVILLTRNWRLPLNWRLWLSAMPVLLFCVPWYLWARGMSRGAMIGFDPNAPLAFFIAGIRHFPWFVAQTAGPLLSVLFLIGCSLLAVAAGKRRLASHWAALLAMLGGVLLLQSIVPASIEPRFMVQLLPCFVLIAAAGAHGLITRLARGWPAQAGAAVAAWPALALLALLTMFRLPEQVRNSGYEAASTALLDGLRGQASPALLVASDPLGEGSVIAAVAALRPAEYPVVLRGSKILISEDWLGRDIRARFQTDASMRAMLDMVPVDAVLVDEAILPHWRRPYHAQLARLVRGDAANWRLGGTYGIVRNGAQQQGLASIYFRVRPEQAAPAGAANLKLIDKMMQRD